MTDQAQTEQPHTGQAPPRARVVITGAGAVSAFGRGTDSLLDGALAGEPAFRQVGRFDADRYRVQVAAELAGSPVLGAELSAVIDEACATARLRDRADAVLLLALHTDPVAARDPAATTVTGGTAAAVAARCGLPRPARIYTTACTAASSAVADAAAMITSGRAGLVVVAAGFLVDADSMALFDAGRALARDGELRPFSAGRRGMLLGDGAAAVVIESAAAAARRGVTPLATLAGWGRAGDGYHVCQPHPEGSGLARAIGAALGRAGVAPAEIGYVNANGTGTVYSDSSEAAALHRALGGAAAGIPVSSTKSLHGHALEASALLELVLTVLCCRAGFLPVNAGYLGPDPDCELDLVLGAARAASPRYALTLNAAFGGASTALLVEAA